jgi:hypothetical protein
MCGRFTFHTPEARIREAFHLEHTEPLGLSLRFNIAPVSGYTHHQGLRVRPGNVPCQMLDLRQEMHSADAPLCILNVSYLTGINALPSLIINVYIYANSSTPREDAIMIISYMNEYDGYPAPELVARAQRAAFERVRREREEKAKRQKLELEEILRHQPNDFAD